MTDSHDDALVPEKPKNKGGRPRKAPDLNQVVKDLQEQIAAMQKAALANMAANADQFERVQQATLAPIPPASENLPAGTYIQRGVDSSGAPIMGKVRWTKEIIERTYPPKTFTPNRGMTVGPHGVLYRMDAGVETTVPSIVKDLYDTALKIEQQESDKYKPWTAAERAELDARAFEQPGVGQRSRLARVGAGLNVHAAEPVTPETPAQ